jgi:hypothetical protein
MPDGRSANPYQTLLAQSVEETGVNVFFLKAIAHLASISRSPQLSIVCTASALDLALSQR